jgi:tetratricopeptide (TPR) repeat protein
MDEVEGATPCSLVGLGWAPMSVIPEEQLIRFAEFGSVDQSPHWHAGLAWILMECEYTDAAIDHFQRALDGSPDGWMPMEGLARCYGVNRSDFNSAIEWMYKAVDNLPRTAQYQSIEFYLYPRISEWKRNLGDIDGAIAAAKTAYDVGKADFVYGTYSASNDCLLRSIIYYISALYDGGRFNDIVQLVYEMDGIETEFPTSLLVQFLVAGCDGDYDIALFDKIGMIVQSTTNIEFLDFVLARLDQALEILGDDEADRGSFIWLAIRTATLKCRYGSRSDESIALWERVMTTIDQSSQLIQGEQSRNRSEASNALAEMYFSAAVAALKAGGDAQTYISPLKKLAKHVQGGLSFYRTSYPAMILGVWLREYEKAGDATWRACFRPGLKEGLYMLSDEDPWNDQAAYAQLGATLLLAGDRLNASISLGIATRILEDAQEREKQSGQGVNKGNQDQTQNEGLDIEHPGGGIEANEQVGRGAKGYEEDKSSHEGEGSERRGEFSGSETTDDKTSQAAAWFWECDGICTEKPYAELHFCEICHDTCFCGSCLAVVKADKMPFRKCRSDHTFVQIFPLTPEAKEITASLIDYVSAKQQKWLESIKETWAITFE